MNWIFKPWNKRQRRNPDRCAASVPTGRDGPKQCSRKPVIQAEVEGKTYGFCRQHNPKAVAQRLAESDKRYDDEAKVRERRINLQHLAYQIANIAAELSDEEVPLVLLNLVGKYRKLKSAEEGE